MSFLSPQVGLRCSPPSHLFLPGEVDRLLEQARRETDYMKRVELYREIEKMVMEEAPIICQHVNSFNYLFQPWVKGVQVSFLGDAYLPFRQVWIEKHAK